MKRDLAEKKRSDGVTERHQDNPEFKNRRYNLNESTEFVPSVLRGLWQDPAVKTALMRKLYLEPPAEMVSQLRIHEEFEYVFTAADRFQNIHIDIPPKYMSFVFYVPERTLTADEEEKNATILYDHDLKPRYAAKYRDNSLCIFVPHFTSYHGFSSTIPRDALVMFYVNPDELASWQSLRQDDKDQPPFNGLLDSIEAKLLRYPLKQFGANKNLIAEQRRMSRVNAPRGRVLRDLT